MLDLIAMLGGGVFRLLPFLVDFFKAKKDADHEFRMTELQLKIDQARATQAIDLAHAQSDIATSIGEMQAWAEAIKGQSTPTGIGWVDAVSTTVRPFLTYYWCIGLYGTAKTIQVVVAFQEHVLLKDFVPILITPFDQQVIGAILAFWFVDRSLRRFSK